MGNFTPEQFQKFLENLPEELEEVVSEILPVIIGKNAVDIYKENFQLQGFQNKEVEYWADVKRRTEGKSKGADTTRKILTGRTGDLGRSIEYAVAAKGSVKIYSDLPYADAHNSGTDNAGRHRNVKIPQRKFIGDSYEVTHMVNKEIKNKFDGKLNF